MRRLGQLKGPLAFLCAGLAFACKQAPVAPKPIGPSYIVFLDLSLSLNDVQQRPIDNAIKRLCDAVPPRSHLTVFPVRGYVQKAGTLIPRPFPDDTSAVDPGEL